jgi:type IV secretion system protein VirB9
MKHNIYSIFLAAAFLSSCTTVHMDRKANEFSSSLGAAGNPGIPVAVEYLDAPAEIVIVEIERPVYIPEGGPAPAAAPAASGQQAVRNSNAQGIIPPSEYSYAAMVYDYNADWVYEVYTQPLRVTDIRLEPGERAVETPFISDSERWIIGAGVSYEGGAAVQHIYVKPTAASLEASLIINTDRRVYHVILKSYSSVYMPMVRWKYLPAGLPNSYVSPSGGTAPAPGAGAAADVPAPGFDQFDPRFVSFNYSITYGWLRKPSWLPELVYDDGRKTYIVFPRSVLQAEFPAVFDDRNNVVNYRVSENIVIIDRLIEKLTARLNGLEIVIQKKRG